MRLIIAILVAGSCFAQDSVVTRRRVPAATATQSVSFVGKFRADPCGVDCSTDYTLPSTIPAGHTAIVLVLNFPGEPSKQATVTDNLSSTYAKDSDEQLYNWHTMSFRAVASAGITTIRVTAATSDYQWVEIYDFTVTTGFDVMDARGANYSASWTAGPVTTTNANDTLFACFSGSDVLTWPVGWTQLTTGDFQCGWKTVSAVDTYSVTVTLPPYGSSDARIWAYKL